MKFEFDSEGYPDEKTLRLVRHYSGSALEFFRALKTGWKHGESGVRENLNARDLCGHRIVRFQLHTWGWSGNEELINAMERNLMLQMLTWEQSRRGGHYVYEFKRDLVIPALAKRKRKSSLTAPR